MEEQNTNYISFTLGDMIFEYDEEKNKKNIQKHGISFKNAARVFFDYDRIELYDEENSQLEDRYNTIGSLLAGTHGAIIGNVQSYKNTDEDILFVVYTERLRRVSNNQDVDVTRLISARYATNFERGLYYGKF